MAVSGLGGVGQVVGKYIRVRVQGQGTGYGYSMVQQSKGADVFSMVVGGMEVGGRVGSGGGCVG